jgi:Tfp pilus assembly protein PilN
LKVLGLSIEDSRVRATVVSKAIGIAKQSGIEEIDLSGEELDRTSTLSAALREWKSRFAIKGVVIGLGFKDFSHHFIDLPVTSRDDIHQALQFEMGKHLPLSPDEYIFDFLTVETTTSGSSNLVFAIKKDRLKWITECITGEGLRLLGVKCSGIEALNAVIETEVVRDATFVYKGPRRHYILGLKNARPVSIRTAATVSDVEKVLERIPEALIRDIYSAGTEDLVGLEKFGIKKVKFSLPELLAVSALKKREIVLDFKPEEFAGKKFNYYPYALVSLCVLSLLLFFSISLLSYYKDYSALKDVNTRIELIRATASELLQTQKELEAIENKKRFLNNFQKTRNRHIEILRSLSIILPENSWLTNFSSDEKGKVEIKGRARRTATLIGPLERSEMFKSVELSSPVTVRGEVEWFSIAMDIEQ